LLQKLHKTVYCVTLILNARILCLQPVYSLFTVSPLETFFRPKMTLVTKVIRSKRGFLEPHKLNDQSETSTAMQEKTGETMVTRYLVDCCFIGVIWCSYGRNNGRNGVLLLVCLSKHINTVLSTCVLKLPR
jgi:hypothetical protein